MKTREHVIEVEASVIEGQEGVVGADGVIFVEKCVIGLGVELES
jgi:hypothetical protein